MSKIKLTVLLLLPALAGMAQQQEILSPLKIKSDGISSSEMHMYKLNNIHYFNLSVDNNGFGIYDSERNSYPFNINNGGNVGIGTMQPDNAQGWKRVLDVYGDVHAKLLVRSDQIKTGIFSNQIWGDRPVGRIGTESAHDLFLMAGYGNTVMTLTTDRYVGIGTTTPTEKLSVNGKIRAHEIKVETSNWPDYVFADDYKLPSLKETALFIQANKHLTGMPTAKEVETNGVDLGEMNKKLLQKVEELTLYLIEKDKQILTQQQDIAEQKKRLDYIEKKLNSILK